MNFPKHPLSRMGSANRHARCVEGGSREATPYPDLCFNNFGFCTFNEPQHVGCLSIVKIEVF